MPNTTIERRWRRSQTPGGRSFVYRADRAVMSSAYRPNVPSATGTLLYSDRPGMKAPMSPTWDFGSAMSDSTWVARKAVTKTHRWSCHGKTRFESFQVDLFVG